MIATQVLSETNLQYKIKEHLVYKLCKFGDSENFGLDSQERYRNYKSQYFHSEFCRRALSLNFR